MTPTIRWCFRSALSSALSSSSSLPSPSKRPRGDESKMVDINFMNTFARFALGEKGAQKLLLKYFYDSMKNRKLKFFSSILYKEV